MKRIVIQKGFTLIELLVVIAIIGILSTLLMSNFIGVRQRARDGRRKADISQIQAALEQYRSDQGSYPPTNAFPQTCQTTGNGSLQDPGNTTTYMQKVPCDPLTPSYYNNGNYYYFSTGTTYTIVSCLENTQDSQAVSYPSGVGAPSTGCPLNSSNLGYYVVNNP
jgi:general secretion pathway protein G